jgi:hypothetical protein
VFIVDSRRIPEGQDGLRVAALESDEEPLEFSPLRIHEVMKLIRKDQRGFTRVEEIAGTVDSQGSGALHDGDQLKPVVIIRTDPLGFERRSVRSLEKDDVIRCERLFDPVAREEARGRRELAKMSLYLREVFGRGLHRRCVVRRGMGLN